MDQAVFQTLTDTLSADTNTRHAAELRLKDLQVNPGTRAERHAHEGITLKHHGHGDSVHSLTDQLLLSD